MYTQETAQLEGLLTQLVKEVETVQEISALPSETQEVLLSWQVGQVSYTLTRQLTTPERVEINLSPREKEIVRLVTRGASNKEIARILDISPYTVATHLRRVFAKLKVCTRAEMVAFVLRDNLLNEEDTAVSEFQFQPEAVFA